MRYGFQICSDGHRERLTLAEGGPSLNYEGKSTHLKDFPYGKEDSEEENTKWTLISLSHLRPLLQGRFRKKANAFYKLHFTRLSVPIKQAVMH